MVDVKRKGGEEGEGVEPVYSGDRSDGRAATTDDTAPQTCAQNGNIYSKHVQIRPRPLSSGPPGPGRRPHRLETLCHLIIISSRNFS